MRILIIEDDQDLCRFIALTLEQSGYATDICHTGNDGLFYAQNHPYDAIILDRMLPGLDGLFVLSSLRRQGIRTPVILATALDGLPDPVKKRSRPSGVLPEKSRSDAPPPQDPVLCVGAVQRGGRRQPG